MRRRSPSRRQALDAERGSVWRSLMGRLVLNLRVRGHRPASCMAAEALSLKACAPTTADDRRSAGWVRATGWK